MKFTTPVVIIGSRENLRNPKLLAYEALAKVEYVAPVLIRPSEQQKFLSSPRISRLSLGRELTLGEIGCAVAHERATDIAQKLGSEVSNSESEWALILEDDAEGDLIVFTQILEFLDSLKIKKPSLINFFSDAHVSKRTRLSKKCTPFRPKLRRQFYWRGITSSYAINIGASRVLTSIQTGKVSYVADWPPTYGLVSFFRSDLILSQSGYQSLIGARPVLSIAARMALHAKQLRHCGDLSRHYGVSRFTILRTLILFPLVRDLVGRFRAFSKK